MNNQYPERKLSILRRVIIAAAVLVDLRACLLAAYYQATFGYHWLVVLFGASALIFVLAAIAIVTAIIIASLSRKRRIA